MSDKEIVKELQSIEGVIKSRISGYIAKYRKKLKSKAYKHNDVLGVGEYVINGNKVLICFQKLVFSDKLSDLGICNIVVTDGNGAFLPFTNEWGRFSYHHITTHAIDRMWQRMGLTIRDFFVNEYAVKAGTSHHLTKYDEYGYDDSTYIMTIGRCFFIVHNDNNKIVVKTTLDRDRIHTNQLMLYVDSKRGAEQFADKVYDKNADTIKRMGIKKTSDVIRAMCA